ncbi:MAG: hypothetical protein GY757_02885, partial [bacterium]|nr:hypothetical protein [bacterium]
LMAKASPIELSGFNWKYHPATPAGVTGDNREWTDPQFDDSSWGPVPELIPENREDTAWYRLHIFIEKGSALQPMGIKGLCRGKVAIYWDGVLVSTELAPLPRPFHPGGVGKHVLAVRLSGHRDGISMKLGNYAAMTDFLLQQKGEQMFFAALMLAIALVNLLLFLFSPDSKDHLYFSIYLIIFAATTFADIQFSFLAADSESAEFFLRVHRAICPLADIFMLLFIYSFFYSKRPLQFRVFIFLFAVIEVLLVLEPQRFFHYKGWVATL